MSQSRKGSLAEALINVLIGYGINMAANFALFPLFGWQISLEQNLLLGVFYTAISICRSYVIRRFFNKADRHSADTKRSSKTAAG